MQRFNNSWDYARQSHHARWRRNRKLYNNERTSVSYEGITNTFVPLTFSTVETLVAALGGGRPSVEFTPSDMYNYIMSIQRTGKKPDLKALNATFDYYWESDNWDLKTIKTIRGGLIEGTSGEWIYWDNDKPRIINLRARDIIVDPTLRDPMDLHTDPKNHYGGRRFLTTLAKLKEEKIADVNNPGKMKRRYNNLHMVTPGYAGADESDSRKRDMYTGAIAADADLIEVIEIWDGNTVKSVANRSQGFTIEDRANELGIIPLAITRFIADEEVIYGKSIIDPIAQAQELLNDVTNQSVDAVTDILTPRWELDPAYADHINLVTESSFGTVFPFAPGSLSPVNKPVVTNGAFNERQNMKNEIREATGADQIVQGKSSDSSGDRTATEINAQMNQAGQRFDLFVRMLEKESFYQRAKIVFKLMLHYQKEKTLIPTMTLDGPKFHVLNPQEFDHSFEPKVQLASTVQQKKQSSEDKYTKAYQLLIQDPTNDLWEAKKLLYPKMFELDEQELDKIIGAQKGENGQPPVMGPDGKPVEDPNAQPQGPDPAELQQMVVQAVQAAMDAKAKEPKKLSEILKMDLSQFTDFERAQILEQMDIQADPHGTVNSIAQQKINAEHMKTMAGLLPEVRNQAGNPDVQAALKQEQAETPADESAETPQEQAAEPQEAPVA